MTTKPGLQRRQQRPLAFYPGLLFVLGLLLFLAGCGDEEYRSPIPPDKLRDILPLSLEAPATRQAGATTQPASRPTTRPLTGEVPLTLEQCRQICLQNNLDLKVEIINPEIAKQSVSQEEAKFEALFSTDASMAQANTPVAAGDQVITVPGSNGGPSQVVTVPGSGVDSVRSTVYQATPSVQIPLRTGGEVQVSSPVSSTKIEPYEGGFNPAYNAGAAVTISQPLLRNAGVETNTHSIRIANLQYQIVAAQTKLEVIRVLASVDRAYWRLYAARQELAVRKQEYDLAVAQREHARRMAAAGQVAEIEILRADSGVADRVQGIITADNALRDRERELKRILNKPDLEMDSPAVITPKTLPDPVHYEIDESLLIAGALTNRSEMLQVELRIAQETSNVAFARNQMLPLVSVAYTYAVNGLGPTLGDAYDMTFQNRYQDHTLGLHVEVPIGNEAARSQLRKAMLARQQQLITREQQAAQIRQDVLNATDQLKANWQQILASRSRVALTGRLLAAEQRQFDLGLQTSTDVLNAQADFADAQLAEVQALTEYQISQVDIAFATGTLLGEAKVDWQSVLVPPTAKP